MLEAFGSDAVARSSDGCTSLIRDGYEFILDADLDVLTGYFTLHRERLVPLAGAVRTDGTVEFAHGAIRVILTAEQERILTDLWPRRFDPGVED